MSPTPHPASFLFTWQTDNLQLCMPGRGLFYSAYLIIMIALLSCTKQSDVEPLYCYDCYNTDSTYHCYYLNSTEEEMQHTINWWATCCQPMTLNCKPYTP